MPMPITQNNWHCVTLFSQRVAIMCESECQPLSTHLSETAPSLCPVWIGRTLKPFTGSKTSLRDILWHYHHKGRKFKTIDGQLYLLPKAPSFCRQREYNTCTEGWAGGWHHQQVLTLQCMQHDLTGGWRHHKVLTLQCMSHHGLTGGWRHQLGEGGGGGILLRLEPNKMPRHIDMEGNSSVNRRRCFVLFSKSPATLKI